MKKKNAELRKQCQIMVTDDRVYTPLNDKAARTVTEEEAKFDSKFSWNINKLVIPSAL